MPQLPRQKELLASLSPYHSKLVGESYLGKRRPFYDCTDVQVLSHAVTDLSSSLVSVQIFSV